MRALVAVEGHRLAVADVSEPAAGPGQVVIEVAACGICGSDLHFLDSPIAMPGLVMGHEFSGTVVAAGEGVVAPSPGDRVVVLPAARCAPGSPEECSACREGASQRCHLQAGTAIGILLPGGFAERVAVPAGSCYPIPETMPFELAALTEPAAVAAHGLHLGGLPAGADEAVTGGEAAGPDAGGGRMARSRAGQSRRAIGILGAGPIGLLVTKLAHDAGLRAGVAEPNPSRRNLAIRMGAAVVTQSASDLPGELVEAPAVLLDCAGTPDTPAQAVGSVRAGGDVILVGVAPLDKQSSLSSLVWVAKEVGVKGAIAYTNEEFGAAVAALDVDPAGFEPLWSDVRPLDAGPDAFAELVAGSGASKILLAPGA